MNTDQTQFLFGSEAAVSEAVQVLIDLLSGRGWLTASQICTAIGLEDSDGNRRRIRFLAAESQGEVACGQKGYKLVSAMTREEYEHYRRWMKSQADQMTRRVLKSDRVYFRRMPVRTGNGILTTD